MTYDVRGAGRSTAPSRRSGNLCARLVDDLIAVLDALRDRVGVDAAVHLVGHDWGSVQLWDAVCAEEHDPRVRGRLASFCSISGPGLDPLAAFGRAARRERRTAALAAQLSTQRRASWYVAAFHLPVLPDLVWRLPVPVLRRLLARADRLGTRGQWESAATADGAWRSTAPTSGRGWHSSAGKRRHPAAGHRWWCRSTTASSSRRSPMRCSEPCARDPRRRAGRALDAGHPPPHGGRPGVPAGAFGHIIRIVRASTWKGTEKHHWLVTNGYCWANGPRKRLQEGNPIRSKRITPKR